MNLHGIASGAIGAVNPFVEAQIYRSNGSIKNADYSVSSGYDEPVMMRVQKQAVTQADMRHLDNLNIQGIFTAIYTNGNWCGINRPKQQGGDKFVINGETWLVVAVPENWPDWTRVIACLQM